MAELVAGLCQITAYHPRRWPQINLHGGAFESGFEEDEESTSAGIVKLSAGGWAYSTVAAPTVCTEVLSAIGGVTLRPIPNWLDNWPQFCTDEVALKSQLGWAARPAATKRDWEQVTGAWLPSIVPGYGDFLWLTCAELDGATYQAEVKSLGSEWQANPNFVWYVYRWAPTVEDLPAATVPYVSLLVGNDDVSGEGGFRIVLPGATNATDGTESLRPQVVSQETGEVLYAFKDAAASVSADNGPRLDIVSVRSVAENCYVVQIGPEQSAVIARSDIELKEAHAWIHTSGTLIATSLCPITFPLSGTATRWLPSAWDPSWQTDETFHYDFWPTYHSWWTDDPDDVSVAYVDGDTVGGSAADKVVQATLTRPANKEGYSPTVYRVAEARTPEFYAGLSFAEDLGTDGHVSHVSCEQTLDNRASTVSFDVEYATGELAWLRRYQWCEVKLGYSSGTADVEPVPWLAGPIVLGRPRKDGAKLQEDGRIVRSVTVKTWAELLSRVNMAFAAGVSFAGWLVRDVVQLLLGNSGVPDEMFTWAISDAEKNSLTVPLAFGWDRGYSYEATATVVEVLDDILAAVGLRWRISGTGAVDIFRPAIWDNVVLWTVSDVGGFDRDQVLSAEGGVWSDESEENPTHIMHIGRDSYGRTLVGHVIDTDALWDESSPYFTGHHTWQVTEDGDNTDPVQAAWQEWVRRQRYRGTITWEWDFHPEIPLGDHVRVDIDDLDVPRGSTVELISRRIELDETDLSMTETVTGGVVRLT